MKREKRMRKKMVSFLIAGALVLALGLTSTPARSELSLGLVGGYYSPNFGKINDEYLDGWNTAYGTDLELKAGIKYGLALGYDLGSRFGLRLEYKSFESKTSQTVVAVPPHHLDLDFKLTVTPVIVSLIYGLAPAYIGAGVGLFPTKFRYGYLVDSVLVTTSDSDSPTGFILLGGFGFGSPPIFLNLEARYVVGTKAKLEKPGGGTEVDLTGLQLCLLVGLKI